MIGHIRKLFTRENIPPPNSDLIQASYRIIHQEYGVKESDGEVIWFSDGKPEDSLPDALRYMDAFPDEQLVLMQRHVSAGREVDHVRFRS